MCEKFIIPLLFTPTYPLGRLKCWRWCISKLSLAHQTGFQFWLPPRI